MYNAIEVVPLAAGINMASTISVAGEITNSSPAHVPTVQ
jgi:hypothetical protein